MGAPESTLLTVPDPYLQIRVGGGGGGDGHPDPEIRGRPDLIKIFSALPASVWSKNKGGRTPRVPHLDPPLIKTIAKIMIACVASVSMRVRRESWDKSKKKIPFFCSCSNFPTTARLVTLATKARIMSG